MLYLLWHQNPDTDAICAPLAWSAYLTDQGITNTVIRLGEINNETRFVLNYAHIAEPALQTTLDAGSHLVLLDHNDENQSIPHRDLYTITWLIDHHAIGKFTTNQPLMIRVEPVGCTCTIVRKIFQEQTYTPSKQTAILMIAAIMSDTLFFRSPTTTQTDKDAVHRLNTYAQIDNLEAFAMAMFDAKSQLDGMTPDQIITTDYKVFSMGTKKIGIWVIETTNPRFALDQKKELLTAMANRKVQDGVHALFVHIVDILTETNTTLVLGDDEEQAVKAIYGAHTQDNIADLGNRISRKKQLVPACEAYFTNH